MPQYHTHAVPALPPTMPRTLMDQGANARLGGIADLPCSGADTAKWLRVAERVGHYVDLDSTALADGAMLRRRGVPTATALLGLALFYGPGGMSLRQAADRAEQLGIAHVSETALLRRLINAAGWLEEVVERLTIEQLLRLATPAEATNSAPRPGLDLNLRSYAAWQRAAQEAKHFLLDFLPWQEDSFNAAQEQWLLCARWNFVASTIQDGPLTRDAGRGIEHTLERVRVLAHVIVALLPESAA
jgi:hypothetical protein